MRVLVACEESQEVCKAFREKGHETYSCDIQECSGGHPEWHIMGDVLPLIDGCCSFTTMDGKQHHIDGEWMRYSRTLWHYCSVCLEDALMSKSTGTEVLSSFCPHCGAKMDLEE